MRQCCVVILIVYLLAACAASPPTHYYTLSLPTSAEPAAGGAPSYRVAVGPVTVPELVDRPLMVLQTGSNEVVIAEQHRWAEPLKSEIPRVVAANLARELGNPWSVSARLNAARDADFRVSIDIQRFESTLNDAATVEALWAIYPKGSSPVQRGHTLAREPVSGAGYDALAAAHGRALAKVSHDVGEAIKGLPGR
jgi:uncharacterized lipoprotein YmbA